MKKVPTSTNYRPYLLLLHFPIIERNIEEITSTDSWYSWYYLVLEGLRDRIQ